ncbi:NAD-dependent dehydratase [Stenotrophomonas maltophilia]|uniref:NAD-dependent dehydratase n=1 Tax=Stenotrophomonas maltophilia TaxID=40324 RepID=UPI00130FBF09|nr:NAD-dependent dehydratase [Stenotrophomonas maltophilia]MBH1676712.1 NAD-dependent dehydratase [Stenotrophomonas maltophilia]MDZ5778449.1 NAD-dependent dehydratase [Stenotrophomonas maltophilia]NUH63245.1 NAD-dependent dehydratase [Stenotrophomonas maltophilia]HDS1625493.1 NAD-dependent dehydratase [Stenotrophomonas maltophilia]HEL3199706.1 NAD-dependent dehydratase [Stenotrophomonas maltophilia]
MRVMLLGATGLVGGLTLSRLLDDPRCSAVVAPTRRPLALTHGKLENPVLAFDALPTSPEWARVDAIICALGSTIAQAGSREAFHRIDHDYPLAFGQLAQAQGARTYVLNSAAGANPQSSIFYSRVKGELERDLRALGFSSLTLVRPGLIGGERNEVRRGERLALKVLGVLGPVLPRAWRINPASEIAKALVEAALAPQPGEHVVASSALVG